MILVTCTDARGGVGFFGKRLSTDSAVIEDVRRLAAGRRIAADAYSAKLFGLPPTEGYGADDVLFVERTDVSALADAADTVVLYVFGRLYPADTFVGFDPEKQGFRRTETAVFSGTSHETITKKVYER